MTAAAGRQGRGWASPTAFACRLPPAPAAAPPASWCPKLACAHSTTFLAHTCSPLFVTWNKASRQGGEPRLRGCIGTLEPRQLHTALADYALTRWAWLGGRGSFLDPTRPGDPDYADTLTQGGTDHRGILPCSALRDRRFAPITLQELAELQCTVSLLHSFERAAAWDAWQIGVHGALPETQMGGRPPACQLRPARRVPGR